MMLLGLLAGTSAITFLIVSEKYRFAIAVTVGLLLIAFSVVSIRVGIVSTLVFLVFMGDIRRMLIPSVGWSGEDPLLLIGPMFAVIVFAYAWSARAVKINTAMAGWVLGLMAVMMLQMLNPKQGGLIVGVAGALFYLVPLLWYWIGRTYATRGFINQVLFYVILPLAFVSAALGLYQAFFGLLPYQEIWADMVGPGVLGSEGIEKPFSFFASPTEYDNFLLSALAILIAALVHRRQHGTLFLIIPLFISILLGGSRGPVAKLLVTGAGLWAVVGATPTKWILRGMLALLIGIGGLTWSLSSMGDIQARNERIEFRLERQQKGLMGSTGEHSSARNHLWMMANGFIQGIKNPLGLGLGATTEAGAKYGGIGASTEVDMSDVFLSTGVVGGLIYLIIVYLIIRSAFQFWVRSRSLLALAIAGVLAINIFLWLRGGQYAVSPLVWFFIGALDRFANMQNGHEVEESSSKDEEPVEKDETTPVPTLTTA